MFPLKTYMFGLRAPVVKVSKLFHLTYKSDGWIIMKIGSTNTWNCVWSVIGVSVAVEFQTSSSRVSSSSSSYSTFNSMKYCF